MVNYEKDNFARIVENSIDFVDVCKHLNIERTYGSRKTIKNYIEKYNLDILLKVIIIVLENG